MAVAQFNLQKHAAFGWSTQAGTGLIGVNGGWSLSSRLSVQCTNTKATIWQMTGQWNGGGTTFTAGPVTYSCGT